MIEEKIFEALNEGVESVEGRVFPLYIPQNEQFPALVYTVVTDNIQKGLSCSTHHYCRLQIDIYDNQFENVKKIEEVVKRVMDSFNLIEYSSQHEFDHESRVFRVILDMNFNY
ncbi:MAG: hypothetical protein IE878_00405 [Epsilonproteobacteria bacterium]|nr:hypothetical protein [Campylobacterota bacterium]